MKNSRHKIYARIYFNVSVLWNRAGDRVTKAEKGAGKGQEYFVVIGGDIWYNFNVVESDN